MTTDLTAILTRWATDEGRPYRGKLIDKAAYDNDPADIGCMCAQGQVLHLLGGWGADRLMNSDQAAADLATAELLFISRAHAVLLRQINDSVNGAPAIVLTHPERVLGDQAQTVLAFWRHLDRMTDNEWAAVRDAVRDAAGGNAWAAARAAARDAAGVAARGNAWNAAWDAAGGNAWAAARVAAWAAAWDAAWAAARDAARDAAWATNEIQGAAVMRGKGQAFYFLPMFGFANPEAVLAAERAK